MLRIMINLRLLPSHRKRLQLISLLLEWDRTRPGTMVVLHSDFRGGLGIGVRVGKRAGGGAKITKFRAGLLILCLFTS
jgi:hypothetical protein